MYKKDVKKYLENDYKAYVFVNEDRLADGTVIPRRIIWEDGKSYDIDKVTDICRAVSLKAGGAGLRYTVKVGGTQTYLFFEEDKWFVVRKIAKPVEVNG